LRPSGIDWLSGYVLVCFGLTAVQYAALSLTEAANREEAQSMGTNGKHTSLKKWLAAGLLTLCSVGTNNVPAIASLLV
jgi:hypothetical protein